MLQAMMSRRIDQQTLKKYRILTRNINETGSAGGVQVRTAQKTNMNMS